MCATAAPSISAQSACVASSTCALSGPVTKRLPVEIVPVKNCCSPWAEVAAGEDISLKYLEQLVRPLMQAGYLKSVRGKGGGYVLARPADEIRAGDILRVAEGTTAPVACEGIDGACYRAGLCSTVKFWQGLDDVIERYVDGVTLADLARVPEIKLEIDLGPLSS